MTVNEAVVALRKHAGQTQQVFATRLGMSISSLQNYERARTPEARQLLIFQREAEAVGRKDLAVIFRAELRKSLAPNSDGDFIHTVDSFETVAVTMLLWLIHTPQSEIAQEVIKQIAKVAELVEVGDEVFAGYSHYGEFSEAVRRGFIKTPPKRRGGEKK